MESVVLDRCGYELFTLVPDIVFCGIYVRMCDIENQIVEFAMGGVK